MYEITKDGERYAILEDGQPVHTPMGRPVVTEFEALAKRLQKDLDEKGEDPSDPTSIVAFHYASLDFFESLPLDALHESVLAGFDPETDWTFKCPTATPEPLMAWMSLFGRWSLSEDPGKAWIRSLNRRQLCAVTVVGRALESVNIPYLVATAVSRKNLVPFATEVLKRYPFYSKAELTTILENYLFYFGLDEAEPAE